VVAFEELTIAGGREHGVVIRRRLDNSLTYEHSSSALCLESLGYPLWLQERLCFVPVVNEVEIVGNTFLTNYAIEHALAAFRLGNIAELAVALITEYGRQLGSGAQPLSNYGEAGKMYTDGGALYLFFSTAQAEALAELLGGAVL